MFKFLQRRKEQREAAEARERTFKQVLTQFQAGKGNPLEAALVLHLVENNEESLPRFLMSFGGSELWILNKSAGRFGDPAVTEGPDGKPYVAAFTSLERAAAAAVIWKLSNRPSAITALELVFALSAALGIVLNADDPHLQWTFTPEHVANLRALFERSHNYQVGGIYSVWTQDTFKVAKLLAVDDSGLHVRIYANAFADRPTDIDPASLTLDSSSGGSIQSVGHMPVTRVSFLAMGPKLLGTASVCEQELEGYRIWAEAKGGYFSTSSPI